LCLAGSILTEVVATIALAASDSFSKPRASIISVACFAAAFWLLSFPLRTMPTGIVYAVWSGMSIVLVTAAAWVWSKQVPDLPAISGMALITAGVVVINAFSGSAITEEQDLIGVSQPAATMQALAAMPTRHVIQEGQFEWGGFKAYSDSSIELEVNGEKRWYRDFAELKRDRKRPRHRSSTH
jgi:small multidrug resistance pump